MAKTQLEVGAVRFRGGWQARVAALTLLAWVWLGAQLPAQAAGMAWQTYLKEDFSGEESMFYTGQAGEAFYSIDDQSRYIINGLDTDSDSLSALTDSLYYYYLEANCELVSSDAENLAFVGLVFHYKKADDGTLSYYVFYMYGDGYYGAKRVIGEQVDIALPLTKSDMIDVGSANTLAVEAQGSRFDLFINGKHVDGFTDLKLDGGGFGFYISKRSEGAFDDFIVKVEKRDTGQEPPDEPNAIDDGASTTFGNYSPLYIPKDPNRPVYPWEVGVDKSKKGKKKAGDKGKDDSQPRVEDDAEDEDSPPDDEGEREPARPRVEPAKKKTGDNGGQPDKPPAKPKAKPPAEPEDDTADGDAAEDAEPTAAPPAASPPQAEPPDAEQPESTPDAPGADAAAGEGSAESAPPEQLPEAEPAEAPQLPAGEELVLPPLTGEEPEQAAPEPPAEAAQPEPAEPAPDAQPHKSSVEAQPELKLEGKTVEQPAAEKPASRAKPEEAKPAEAQQSRADRDLDKMRGRQDDWMDPNKGSPVVQEVRAPVPEPPAATDSKQEVPQQDEHELQLPDAPDVDSPDQPADEQGATPPEESLELLPPPEQPATEPPPAAPEPEPEPQSDAAPPPEPEIPQVEAPPPASPGDTAGSAPRVEADPAQQVEPAEPTKLSELPQVEPQPAVAPEILPEPAPPAAQPGVEPGPAPTDPNLVQLSDDFSQQLWAVAEGQNSSYRYFGAAYEINNLNSATMALSFQQETLATARLGCDVEFIDGVSYVGYGLAARFSAKDGNPTYYGLFICQSGEFMLLRVVDGKETVLQQWSASTLLKPNQPNRIELELAGSQIKAYLNGELATSLKDEAIAQGGYALLAGPGVAARFDNFSLRGTR